MNGLKTRDMIKPEGMVNDNTNQVRARPVTVCGGVGELIAIEGGAYELGL